MMVKSGDGGQIRESKYGFINSYFPDLKIDYFSNAKEEYKAWERFIDMCCMILLLHKENEHPFSCQRIGCLLKDNSLIEALEPREYISFFKFNYFGLMNMYSFH